MSGSAAAASASSSRKAAREAVGTPCTANLDRVDYADAIARLERMVDTEVTVGIIPTSDQRRITVAVRGTLRRGDLDRAAWSDPAPIMLPDDAERLWLRVEVGNGEGGIDFYLAPSWFTGGTVAGRAGLVIELGDITLAFSSFTVKR
jgi:hypothetical protein